MNFFDEAVAAHMKWKLRLREFVDGRAEAPDARAVHSDAACDLGRWLHGEGACYDDLAEYRVLRDEHARFHRCAARVVESMARGDREGAAFLLLEDPELADASGQTVMAIGRLRRAIERRVRQEA